MNLLSLTGSVVSLVPLDATHATEIFNSNQGNVKDNFYKFSNLKDVKKWIQSNLILINYGVKIEFVILSITQEFLGMVALDHLDSDIAEFKIWIDQDSQKKGFASNASFMVIDYFNKEFATKQLKYVSQNNNEASMALASKLGFHLTRTFTDESNKKNSVFVLKINNN